MIKEKLKYLKNLEKKTKKINRKEVGFYAAYCGFFAIVISFIIKNIFIIPFTFLGLITFSVIYIAINNQQYRQRRKLIIKKVKEIEKTEDSLFKVLFNKEENFDLMKELLASNKIDKDEIEEMYVNLSKNDYESLDVKKYIEIYEYLSLLLELKEKKSILEDIEDQIEEGLKKPFTKKIDQIKKLFNKNNIKDSDIRVSKDKKKKMVIKKL